MLRPTPKEVIAGIQRNLLEVLAPELKSPFALAQAVTAAAMLHSVSGWLDSFPKYDAAEVEDLQRTFDAMRPHGETGVIEAAGFREALDSGVRASDEQPADRHAMEAAMSALASGVATGRIAGPVAGEVRGYLKRHIERVRALMGTVSLFE